MTLMVYSLKQQCWSKVYGNGRRSSLGSGESVDIITDSDILPNTPSFLSPSSSSSTFHHDYEVTGTPPPGRNGHTATLATRQITGGGRSTCIFIIGGWLGAGPLAASDMHILDITSVNSHDSTNHIDDANGNSDKTNERKRCNAAHWIPINPLHLQGPSPGPCNMHSADFIPTRQEIYVFRGGNGREYLNDLHAFNVDTFTWRVVESRGKVPLRRANHSSAFLVEREELFIFGGWNGTERLNDIHILDTVTSTWSQPHVGGVLPHPRAGMTLTAVRDRLYLFGGSGTSSKCFQDLHVLNRKDMSWLDLVHSSKSTDGSSSSQTSESLARKTNDKYKNTNAVKSDRQLKNSYLMEWDQSPDSSQQYHRATNNGASANPNETEPTPTLHVTGKSPGRRAGHTATAVHDRHIYIFGGSCGQDYLNDFFRLDTDPAHPPTTETHPTSLQLLGGRLRYYCNRGGGEEGDDNDDTFADVCFIVEGKKVYGHRMVLSLVSDYYRAMFSKKRRGGGFKESGGGGGILEIEVPNCSYEAFLMMMEYIYSGEEPKINIPLLTVELDNGDFDTSCCIKSSDEGSKVIETVVDLLQLADQYFLDHLKQICERRLQSTVNTDTVECLLQVAQKSNAVQLESVCQHFIRNRVEFSLHNKHNHDE